MSSQLPQASQMPDPAKQEPESPTAMDLDGHDSYNHNHNHHLDSTPNSISNHRSSRHPADDNDNNCNASQRGDTNTNTHRDTHDEATTDDEIDSDSPDDDSPDERRPNRWRGAPSTWRAWTARERRAWAALENLRCADLAAHLYNAFGLRKRLREWPVVEEEEEEDGADEKEGEWEGEGEGEGSAGMKKKKEEDAGREWRPSKLWTAWPMRADEVPGDDLLPRTRDANEAFTLRRDDGRRPYAGENLEAEISAVMLRHAKERFRRRDLRAQHAGHRVVPSVERVDDSDADSTVAPETTEWDENDTDAPTPRTPKRRRKLASPTFTPVPSADDDRSYALLRPAAREIMSRLDDTLMVLHNARVAALSGKPESSAASEQDQTEAEAAAKKPESPKPKASSGPPPAPKSRGGRPRKVHVPREGETEQEMLIRIAREGKRRIPRFPPAKSETGEEGESDERKSRTRTPHWASASSRARSQSSKASPTRPSSSPERLKETRLLRKGLRDWRDVLGAAALAGFPPSVVSRAAQRCATLFREEMVIHTLPEQPATSRRDTIRTVRYVPGAPLPPSSDEEDDERQDDLFQRLTVSRQSSVRPCATGASSPDLEAEIAGRTSRRSRSATPGPVSLCPYPDCPRSVEGFAKRSNLTRHLRKVHGKEEPDLTENEGLDSMDEMEGGVHVDGFLQPIKIRRGWRGEDETRRQPRSRSKRAKERAGSEELDSGGQFLMNEPPSD